MAVTEITALTEGDSQIAVFFRSGLKPPILSGPAISKSRGFTGTPLLEQPLSSFLAISALSLHQIFVTKVT